MQTAEQQQPENKSRKQLALMLVIMVATLGGSYLLFLLAQNSGVWGTVNKGEFVTPATSVTDFNWRTVEGVPFSNEFPEAYAPVDVEQTARGVRVANELRQRVKRTWWLLAVAEDGCMSACQDALNHMRALQILLTKDATRVRRALVLPVRTDPAVGEKYPRLIQLSNARDDTNIAPGIYIVDPTGVMVLRYPLVDSAADIKKDLKRLLKYSQLG